MVLTFVQYVLLWMEEIRHAHIRNDKENGREKSTFARKSLRRRRSLLGRGRTERQGEELGA